MLDGHPPAGFDALTFVRAKNMSNAKTFEHFLFFYRSLVSKWSWGPNECFVTRVDTQNCLIFAVIQKFEPVLTDLSTVFK